MSFPRRRESSSIIKILDARLRGHDETFLIYISKMKLFDSCEMQMLAQHGAVSIILCTHLLCQGFNSTPFIDHFIGSQNYCFFIQTEIIQNFLGKFIFITNRKTMRL